ncbi:hypothetical protein QWZ08_15555 [Ferruginibacter paludis]|uniref:hypothetical protein n=1 Tax=Ferruginibacter paludis TaxID=1310417 RepID=UPI0025B481AE|nr:hypothetical protein [Ferruginibacter paludis]MDN3657065.1 hypothetical protein [Ferruginibacter paludis]
MKLSNLVLLILIVEISFQLVGCGKCHGGNLYLDNSRSWLPLKGKTQLTFLDETGQPKNFQTRVIDTAQTYLDSGCNLFHTVEYIQVVLYLNSSRTDSIFIQLATPSSLSIRAYTDTSFNMGIGGDLTGYGGSHGNFQTRLYNFNNGNKKYAEVLLIKHAEGYSNSIDSLLLANGTGIIGFNYFNKKYILQ